MLLNTLSNFFAQWLNAMYANFLGAGQWPAMKEIARWLWLGIFELRGKFYDGTCMTQTRLSSL